MLLLDPRLRPPLSQLASFQKIPRASLRVLATDLDAIRGELLEGPSEINAAIMHLVEELPREIAHYAVKYSIESLRSFAIGRANARGDSKLSRNLAAEESWDEHDVQKLLQLIRLSISSNYKQASPGDDIARFRHQILGLPPETNPFVWVLDQPLETPALISIRQAISQSLPEGPNAIGSVVRTIELQNEQTIETALARVHYATRRAVLCELGARVEIDINYEVFDETSPIVLRGWNGFDQVRDDHDNYYVEASRMHSYSQFQR